MKNLYVGQMVRILWSNTWPELSGHIGIITRPCPDSGEDGTSEWNVAPDCWGSHTSPIQIDGELANFGPSSDQLEPILYDGAQPIAESFEEMMGKLREGVVA